MPGARISRTLVHAITSSLLSRAASLIAPFLIMPAMLRHLGSGGFGIWVTGVSVIGLAGFMDFGIGNSLLTRLSGHFGRNDVAAARRDIGSAYRMLGLIFLVGLGLLLLGLCLVWAWPRGRTSLVEGDGGLVLVTLLFFLMGLPLSVVYRIFYAHQQIGLYNLLLVIGAALSVGLTMSAIAADLPGWIVVTIYSAVPPSLMLLSTVLYFHRNPDYRPQRQDFGFDDDARALLRLGLAYLALGILMAVGTNIDISLVLYSLGSDAVTNFAMPGRIGSLLQIIVVTVFLPLWSFNGAAMARQDYAWVRRNTLRMSLGASLAIALLGLALVFGIDHIMQLWVGHGFPDQRRVIAGMALAATIIAAVSPWNMVLNAAGVIRVQIWGWGAFVLVSILAKVVLIPLVGAWIAPLVTAVAYAICIAPAVILFALRLTRS